MDGLFRIFVLFSLLGLGLGYRKYYMQDDYCGEQSGSPKDINMKSDNISSLQFYSQKSSYYKDNRRCYTRIIPNPGKGLIITIRRLRTRAGFFFDSRRCSEYDYVTINRNGRSWGFCGSGSNLKYEIYSETMRGTVTIEFRTIDRTSLWRYEGFKLIITEYSLKSFSNSFKCRRADRYIDDKVKCDGYNNCGDDSDEGFAWGAKCKLSTGAIIGIAIAGVVFLGLVIGTVAFCCKKSSAREVPTETHIQHRPQAAYPEPAYAQPEYNQPGYPPQGYPQQPGYPPQGVTQPPPYHGQAPVYYK